MIGLNLPVVPDLEDALVAVSQHAPGGVHIGRPSVGQRLEDGSVQIATCCAFWFVAPAGGGVTRVVERECGQTRLMESVDYRDGAVIDCATIERVIDSEDDAV